MTKQHPWFFLTLAGLAVGLALMAWGRREQPSVEQLPFVTVTIGPTVVVAELATTREQHQAGLAGRNYLAPNRGMLFVFSAPGRPAFWMRGMNFPLDLLWIADGEIKEITPNVPTPRGNGPVPVYQPKTTVTAVLEVPAGFSQRRQIAPGMKVQWPAP